jgi:DNA-binding transcriptional ArsR family regulator
LKTKIIYELKQKSLTVSELIEKTNSEQSQLSHALSNLRKCSIIDFKQKGKNRIYFLNKKTILPILKIIDKHKLIHCGGKCKK